MDFKIENVYVNNEAVNNIPAKEESIKIEKVECTNEVKGTWNGEEWLLELDNYKKDTACSLYFTNETTTKTEDVKNPATAQSRLFAGLEVIIIVEFIVLLFFLRHKSKKSIK